ncbi:MAG: nucleotide disphospho-sugar-binding domain-containing protein, partial [Bacteroidota bacterium]
TKSMNMIDVLFFPDFEAGHVFPTFKIAENLKRKGYRVAYIGIEDVMKKVAKEGFENYAIFQDVYPYGFIEKIKKNRIANKNLEDRHTQAIIEGELDELFQYLNPKMLICSCHILLESLALHYKYNCQPCLYWPHFPFNIAKDRKEANFLMSEIIDQLAIVDILDSDPDILEELMMSLLAQGKRFTKIEQIVAPMKEWTHLLTCPMDFEINRMVRDEREVFLGPGVRQNTAKNKSELLEFLPKKDHQQLIYASMGSQVAVYPQKAKKTFRLLIECMRQEQMKDFHLTMSVSGLDCRDIFKDLPENVSVHSWVPQVDILQHAALAIVHGGLGSVKECVVNNVPMLTVPMGRDQHDNGIRIRHHQMGLDLDIDKASGKEMLEMILQINHNPAFRAGMSKMRKLFLEEDAKLPMVKFVESKIGVPSQQAMT